MPKAQRAEGTWTVGVDTIQAMLLDKQLISPSPSEGLRPLEQRLAHVSKAVRKTLEGLDLDLTNPGLADTAQRVAGMYVMELFGGLDFRNFPKLTFFPNQGSLDEVVLIDGIAVRSMCEHHLLPFVGTAKIAYIPGPCIMGLSKFNRVVDFFCRRPQTQEVLTQQIHATLALALQTEDVAVVIQASHLCTVMRGIRDINSQTSTSKLSGRFMSNPALRAEFFNLGRNPHG